MGLEDLCNRLGVGLGEAGIRNDDTARVIWPYLPGLYQGLGRSRDDGIGHIRLPADSSIDRALLHEGLLVHRRHIKILDGLLLRWIQDARDQYACHDYYGSHGHGDDDSSLFHSGAPGPLRTVTIYIPYF